MNIWPRKKTVDQICQDGLISVRSGSLNLYPSNFQHIGVRDSQEDSFAFSNLSNEVDVSAKGILAVVADGMGGLAQGEKASQTAVATFLKEYLGKEETVSIYNFLERVLIRSNTAVYDLAYSEEKEIELGTTIVAGLIHNGKLYWVSVGDSRIYHFRSGELTQLTTDHIYANHLAVQVEEGRLSRREAEEHPERGYLTGYLGLPELVESECCKEPVLLESGDMVILCSDGLCNSLSPGEMITILKTGTINMAEKLGGEAISKHLPYQDNTTVIVLTCR